MTHEKPEVMDIGLQSMYDLNDKVGNVEHVCSTFYSGFYSLIIENTFLVLTDMRHLSGFKL